MARGFSSVGEAINHYNGVRIRVTGQGNLQVNVFSLDDDGENPTDVPVQELVPYAMSVTTNKQPTLLANVKEQRASIEIKVTEIDEYFQISRIVVFYKPLWTSFPGRG